MTTNSESAARELAEESSFVIDATGTLKLKRNPRKRHYVCGKRNADARIVYFDPKQIEKLNEEYMGIVIGPFKTKGGAETYKNDSTLLGVPDAERRFKVLRGIDQRASSLRFSSSANQDF
jgi:hypothetical protein